jgi:hypothetical protein
VLDGLTLELSLIGVGVGDTLSLTGVLLGDGELLTGDGVIDMDDPLVMDAVRDAQVLSLRERETLAEREGECMHDSEMVFDGVLEKLALLEGVLEALGLPEALVVEVSEEEADCDADGEQSEVDGVREQEDPLVIEGVQLGS